MSKFLLLLGVLLACKSPAPVSNAEYIELLRANDLYEVGGSVYAYPPLGYPPYTIDGTGHTMYCWDTYGACE